MKFSKIYPVILCGGNGTRLWPLSRNSYPKQFLHLNSKSDKSLLQQTQQRIVSVKNLQDPILICNERHRFIVAEQMRELDISMQKLKELSAKEKDTLKEKLNLTKLYKDLEEIPAFIRKKVG